MCGIAGLITSALPNHVKRIRIKHMMRLLAHRGPDDEGVFEDSHGCLGHCRLSIIDLSSGGHQPMVDGNHVLVFNGEIYNHNELRKELETRGVEFRSHSDTEVLLRGFQVWGYETPMKLRGMFSFALWDSKERRLFCARDPFGKKPFYYYCDNRQFIFASEVEAVVAGLNARPNIDYFGLSHYLLKGYFGPEKSVYGSVRTLGAGQCLEVNMRDVRIKTWPYLKIRFALGRALPIEYETLTKNCNDLLGRAVDRRFESDVPVGVTLSGGVDSSLVSLISAERQPQHQTFTVSFKNAAFDETQYATQIASRVRSDHVVVDVAMNSLQNILPRLIEAYGEPYGDFSAIPSYCLFQAIKPYIKVGLMGDGGDEVFGGYKDAKLYLLREKLSKFVGIGDLFPESLLFRFINSTWGRSRELGYAIKGLQSDGSKVFQALRRSGWTSFWRRKMMRPEVWRNTGECETEREEGKKFMNLGQTDLERYLNFNLERLTQDFLVKIDRASMAHSIEARSPFLDVDLFEQVKGISKEMLFRNFEPKSILKDLLDSRMGNKFSRRRKMGFTPPLVHWLRDDKTRSWIQKRLTDKDCFIYSLFEPDAIRHILSAHRAGEDHTARLWNLLFLNEWHSRFYGFKSSVS